MPRKVDRWTKVPQRRAPGWFQLPIFVRSLGAELVIEADGEPIPVDGDWRVSLCRLLRVDGRDRGNVVRALEKMVEKGLLTVTPTHVELQWSTERPVDAGSAPGRRPVDVQSTPGLHRVNTRSTSTSTQPVEIIKDTSPRQLDRQERQTAQQARANGFDHSSDQKLVLRCWHEVTAETGQPRADRLEQVTAACARQAAAEKLTLEAIARRAFAKFMADAYAAAAKNRFALLASQVDGWVAPPPVEKPALKSEAHREWVPPAWAREDPPVIERPPSEPTPLMAAKPPAKVQVGPVLTRVELEAQIAKYEEHLPKLAGIAAEQIRTKIALLRAQLKAAS